MRDPNRLLRWAGVLAAGLLAACGSGSGKDALTSSASGDPAAAQVIPPGFCAAPQVECFGACVDLTADRFNCGGCGIACPAGQTCQFGACSSQCAVGSVTCGTGGCRNLRSDRLNCGACGFACGPMQACSSGVCVAVTTCQTGNQCGGVCVDLANDPQNCGQCGLLCPRGISCVNGHCGTGQFPVECPGGLSACLDGCVDLLVDPSNCGFCGRACAEGSVCVSGTCL